jgi:hypothetical protein
MFPCHTEAWLKWATLSGIRLQIAPADHPFSLRPPCYWHVPILPNQTIILGLISYSISKRPWKIEPVNFKRSPWKILPKKILVSFKFHRVVLRREIVSDLTLAHQMNKNRVVDWSILWLSSIMGQGSLFREGIAFTNQFQISILWWECVTDPYVLHGSSMELWSPLVLPTTACTVESGQMTCGTNKKL